MEVENYPSFNFEEFIDAEQVNLDVNLPDIAGQEEPVSLKKDNRLFLITGAIALVAGVTMMLGHNLPHSMKPDPGWIAAGIGAFASVIGLSVAYTKVFLRKKISLPSIPFLRKSSTRGRVRSTPNRRKSIFKRGVLAKSRKDKVFLGVAAGLAEYADITPSMMRLIFIFAFTFSGGAFALAYLALGFFLPTRYEDGTVRK